MINGSNRLRERGEIGQEEGGLGLGRHDAVAGVEEEQGALVAELGLRIEEGVGGFRRAELAEGGVDELEPGLRHRLVITAGGRVLDAVRGIVGLDAAAQPLQLLRLGDAVQVEVSDLEVGAVIPLLVREGVILEAAEVFCVSHGIKGDSGSSGGQEERC